MVRLHQKGNHLSLWFLRSQGREKESPMRLYIVWLIATLALVILTAPLAVEAQPPTHVHRIGVLLGTTPGQDPYTGAFLEAMRALGYVEGQNLVLTFRYAEGSAERLPALAAELVRL